MIPEVAARTSRGRGGRGGARGRGVGRGGARGRGGSGGRGGGSGGQGSGAVGTPVQSDISRTYGDESDLFGVAGIGDSANANGVQSGAQDNDLDSSQSGSQSQSGGQDSDEDGTQDVTGTEDDSEDDSEDSNQNGDQVGWQNVDNGQQGDFAALWIQQKLEWEQQARDVAAMLEQQDRDNENFFQRADRIFGEKIYAGTMFFVRMFTSITRHPGLVALLMLAFLASHFFSSPTMDRARASQNVTSAGVRYYGPLDVKHNIGQFIPYAFAHPISFWNRNDVLNLQLRMDKVEYDIAYLQKQRRFHEDTINRLKRALPDFVVIKTDKNGVKQIPADFWHAIKDKIHRDFEVPGSGNAIDPKGGLYQRFLGKNQAKVDAWSQEDFDESYGRALNTSFNNRVLVSRTELLDLLKQNYKDSSTEVNVEIAKLSKNLERKLVRLQDEVAKSSKGITKEEVETISAAALRSLIPAAQLEALALANIQINVNHSLRRVNFFSLPSGSVVDASITSPTYLYDRVRVGWWKRRLLARAGIPMIPRAPASEALRPWSEAGECWCAATDQNGVQGISLGIITNRFIYPEEVVIEHVPKSATLTPGSTPKDMELLVYIGDLDGQAAAHSLSRRIFDHLPEEGTLSEHWVRVAAFQYDIDSTNHIQAFPVDLDLGDIKGLDTSSNKLLVRALTNWGGEAMDRTCFYRVRLHGRLASASSSG